MDSQKESCLFCKIITGEIPAQRVFENEHAIAFKDISPRAPTHVLIVPKNHIEKFSDLKPDDALMVGQLMTAVCEVARALGLAGGGYRLIINNGESAGQSVWHLHVHLMAGRNFQWPPG